MAACGVRSLHLKLQMSAVIPFGKSQMHQELADRDLAAIEGEIQALQKSVRQYKNDITEESYEALVELLGVCKAWREMVDEARKVKRGFIVPSKDEYKLDGVRALKTHLFEKTKAFQVQLLESKESHSNGPASDITAVVTATDEAVKKV